MKGGEILRRKLIFIISLCLIFLMTACKADESVKSTTDQTNEKKDSVHIQEEKVQQKTNPATVEVENS